MNVKMQHFFLLFYCLFFTGLLNGQFTMTYAGNGNYQYNSFIPSNHLTFYLLGDGHYTFADDHTHQYNINNVPTNATVYYAEPYDGEDVDKFIFSDVQNGISNNNILPKALYNKVDIISSWNLVENHDNYYILRFEGNKYDPVDGCIEFHYNKNELGVIDPEILDDYNNWVNQPTWKVSDYSAEGYTHMYTWEFDNLQFGEQRFIYIPTQCMMPSSSQIDTRAVIKIDNDCPSIIPATGDNEGNNGSNGMSEMPIYTLTSVVHNNPHDPNYIDTNKDYISELDVDETIRYRVYFQNAGVDPVVDVDVDLLLETIPPNGVELIDASDDCLLTWDINDPQHLKVIFNNIMLPGSLDPLNPPIEETIGWVDLDICYNLTLLSMIQEKCILVSGGVEFDNEPAIPLAENIICREVAYNPNETCNYFDPDQEVEVEGHNLKNIAEVSDIFVRPNPATSYLILENLDLRGDETIKIIITDTNGSIVKKNILTYLDVSKAIDVSCFERGLYFIYIFNDKNEQILKFAKI